MTGLRDPFRRRLRIRPSECYPLHGSPNPGFRAEKREPAELSRVNRAESGQNGRYCRILSYRLRNGRERPISKKVNYSCAWLAPPRESHRNRYAIQALRRLLAVLIAIARGDLRVAQRDARPAAAQAFVSASAGARPARDGDTKIIGTVIDIRQVPVANAQAAAAQSRRPATSNRKATSNENGEYEFTVAEPGTYVVEMVLVDGYVVALSNAGSLAPLRDAADASCSCPAAGIRRRSAWSMPQNVATFFGMSAPAVDDGDDARARASNRTSRRWTRASRFLRSVAAIDVD